MTWPRIQENALSLIESISSATQFNAILDDEHLLTELVDASKERMIDLGDALELNEVREYVTEKLHLVLRELFPSTKTFNQSIHKEDKDKTTMMMMMMRIKMDKADFSKI